MRKSSKYRNYCRKRKKKKNKAYIIKKILETMKKEDTTQSLYF